MMFFVDRCDHTVTLFLDAHILTVTFLYYESISSLMHDINNGKAPQNILREDVHKNQT
jgi:hypothetical protein